MNQPYAPLYGLVMEMKSEQPLKPSIRYVHFSWIRPTYAPIHESGSLYGFAIIWSRIWIWPHHVHSDMRPSGMLRTLLIAVCIRSAHSESVFL